MPPNYSPERKRRRFGGPRQPERAVQPSADGDQSRLLQGVQVEAGDAHGHVAGIAACEQLAADITSGPLSRPLKYPYHPHVTVAQDVSESALDAIYHGLTSFEARFPVESFTLYEHGPDGRWQPHRRFVLSGDGVATQP